MTRQFKIERPTNQHTLQVSLGWARLWLIHHRGHKVKSCWQPEKGFVRLARDPFIVALFWPRTFKRKRWPFPLPMGGAKWN